MSDPAFDGLCGIPCSVPVEGGQFLRCQFEMGHAGVHSWHSHQGHIFRIGGSFTVDDAIRMFLPVPEHCRCTPIRAQNGVIAEYIFAPDCPAHAKKKAEK